MEDLEATFRITHKQNLRELKEYTPEGLQSRNNHPIMIYERRIDDLKSEKVSEKVSLGI